MRYFAPERPVLEGTEERLIVGCKVPLPGLELTPCEDGSWEICCFLPSEGNMRFSFSRREFVLSSDRLIVEWLEEWLSDPEKILKECFRWEPSDPKLLPKESPLSVEDELKKLGLGD